jgi:GGDEF domain-containing protein
MSAAVLRGVVHERRRVETPIPTIEQIVERRHEIPNQVLKARIDRLRAAAGHGINDDDDPLALVRDLYDVLTHDALTGLYNGIGSKEFVPEMIANAQAHGRIIQVLYLDMIGLKAINDAGGHDEGDRYLVMGARMLKKCFRKGDFIARMNGQGDEFMVVQVMDHPCSPRLLIDRLIRGDIMKYFHIGWSVLSFKREERQRPHMFWMGEGECFESIGTLQAYQLVDPDRLFNYLRHIADVAANRNRGVHGSGRQ